MTASVEVMSPLFWVLVAFLSAGLVIATRILAHSLTSLGRRGWGSRASKAKDRLEALTAYPTTTVFERSTGREEKLHGTVIHGLRGTTSIVPFAVKLGLWALSLDLFWTMQRLPVGCWACKFV